MHGLALSAEQLVLDQLNVDIFTLIYSSLISVYGQDI